MYTFTNKLRNLSIILMVAGFLGLTYGFLSAPNSIEDAQAMVDTTEGALQEVTSILQRMRELAVQSHRVVV